MAIVGNSIGPFTKALMDAGLLPPQTKSYTIRVPLEGAVEIQYNCYAECEMGTKEMGEAMAKEIVGKHAESECDHAENATGA